MLLDRYVGIPWRARGRGQDGCDCWGLLALVYARLGVTLPSYRDDYSGLDDREVIAALIDSGRADWLAVPLGEERPSDALLIRDAPWHVGIIVRKGLMLHMRRGASSCVEPYSSGRWGASLEGVYRHKAMPAALP